MSSSSSVSGNGVKNRKRKRSVLTKSTSIERKSACDGCSEMITNKEGCHRCSRHVHKHCGVVLSDNERAFCKNCAWDMRSKLSENTSSGKGELKDRREEETSDEETSESEDDDVELFSDEVADKQADIDIEELDREIDELIEEGSERNKRCKRIEEEVNQRLNEESLQDMSIRVAESAQFILKFRVVVRGGASAAPIEVKGVQTCNVKSGKEMQDKLFDCCKGEIKGKLVLGKKVTLETLKEDEPTLLQFSDFVKVKRPSRQKNVPLMEYSESQMREDMKKDAPLDVFVYVFGPLCSAPNYNKFIKNFGGNGGKKDRSGSVEAARRTLLITELKQKQHGKWIAKVDGNWGIWVEHILMQERMGLILSECLSAPSPPFDLIDLFLQPNSIPEDRLRKLNVGAKSAIRFVTAMKNQAEELLRTANLGYYDVLG
jgi:GAF domain-containing protein